MKEIGTLFLCAVLTVGCSAQEKQSNTELNKEKAEKPGEMPGGTWKVDKEFDEHGNLIRYDSIYSWSSKGEPALLEDTDRDSILQTMRSKFYRNFSHLDTLRFGNIFGRDSLFTRHFFNEDFFHSDFGRDFMDIESIRKRMEAMQRKLLDQYIPEAEKSYQDSLEVN
jgi:hypothetical protein